MIFLWFLCIVLCFFYYRKISRFKFEVMINDFLGPKIRPFFGNLGWVLTTQENLFKNLRFLARKYSTYRFWILHRPVINIGTAEDAEEFFTTNKNISKDEIYFALRPWLGTGLLTNEGDEKWKKRRKLITPAFHFTILKKFLGIISEQSDKLVKFLQNECQSEKINVFPIMSEFTLKVICETAMGVTLETDNVKHKSYIDAVNEYCTLVIKVACSPWLHNATIIKKTETGRKFQNCKDQLLNFTDFVLKERKKNYEKIDFENQMKIAFEKDEEYFGKKRLALLDILLNEKSKGNIDDEGIKEEVNTFLFAGHDTTATALSFVLLNLANNKEIQDKIVLELHEILGQRTKITFQDLQEMHYLERCIKESMRIFPSVPVISRKTKYEMKAGKHTIPPETNVLVHIFDIHHDPKYYPNPEIFDPDRFLPENVKNRHPFAFVPFSAGPRNCIGQKFAMLEMKTVVSAILLHFELYPILKTEDLKLVLNIVLKNNEPILVKFIPRSK